MSTKIRLLLILTIFILLVSPCQVYSQQAFIEGKIINSSTAEPVPFAAIKLKNHQLGVFANAEGDFKIMSNPEFQADSLIISCIGFKRNSIAFSDLKGEAVNKIYLVTAVYGLKEVKVTASRKKLGPLQIIGRAIRSIKNNYPDKPYNYISYYRDYQKKEGNYINLNEAIVQTLDKGFNTMSVSNKYRLLDYKKNMDFPRMNISPYYDLTDLPNSENGNKRIPIGKLGDQYGNELFILMVHDPIRNFKTRSFSFIEIFSENFIFNHDFSEPEKVLNNNLPLYKINFTGKRNITGDTLEILGAIYIQPKDYSIHKLEYECSLLKKGKNRKEIITKKEIFNVDIEYGYENTVNSLMCLKYISFNNLFNVVDSTDNNFFKLMDSHWESSTPYQKNKFPNLNMIFEFNKKVDPVSARNRDNYLIMIGPKTAKIRNIDVRGNKLYIRVKDDNFKGSLDSCKATIQNLKDIEGNMLNKRKSIELYQFRELFVQEYNKSLALRDSCDMEYLPLDQNCISKYSGKDKYWMNTPEKIKSGGK